MQPRYLPKKKTNKKAPPKKPKANNKKNTSKQKQEQQTSKTNQCPHKTYNEREISRVTDMLVKLPTYFL